MNLTRTSDYNANRVSLTEINILYRLMSQSHSKMKVKLNHVLYRLMSQSHSKMKVKLNHVL